MRCLAQSGSGWAGPPRKAELVRLVSAPPPKPLPAGRGNLPASAGGVSKSIVFAFTTTSYVLGTSGEQALTARLEQRSQGIPVLLPCVAAAAAFRALAVRRIALFHPPWFPDDVVQEGGAYFQRQGFEVVHASHLAPAREVPHPNLGSDVSPAALYEWIRTHAPFSRTYPNVDTPCLVSGSCCRQGSGTRPVRHRASALRSPGGVPGRGPPGQLCSVLPPPRSGAVPDPHDGRGVRPSAGDRLHQSG
jgi:hypothetical protein